VKHPGRPAEHSGTRNVVQCPDLRCEIFLILRQVADEADELFADRRPQAEDHDKGEQHRREDGGVPANPKQVQPAHGRRQEQAQQHRERDRLEHRPGEIKPGDRDGADHHPRHAAERALFGSQAALEPRRRLASLFLHPDPPPLENGMAGDSSRKERLPVGSPRGGGC
jgi:hypothetical protein